MKKAARSIQASCSFLFVRCFAKGKVEYDTLIVHSSSGSFSLLTSESDGLSL